MPNNIKLNLFYGIHEADPEGEYNAMMSILENQKSSKFSKIQISTVFQSQMSTKIIETDFNRISDFIGKPLRGSAGVVKNISTIFPPQECNSICFCIHSEKNPDAPPKDCLNIHNPVSAISSFSWVIQY